MWLGLLVIITNPILQKFQIGKFSSHAKAKKNKIIF